MFLKECKYIEKKVIRHINPTETFLKTKETKTGDKI